MEKLYRPRPIGHGFTVFEPCEEVNIEHDNKAFDITDSTRKSLDYLDYHGTLAKGALAAQGVIKICPSCKGKFNEHYGASVPICAHSINKNIEQNLQNDDLENEWDNIFLKRNNETL